jgi:hypothetical protein
VVGTYRKRHEVLPVEGIEACISQARASHRGTCLTGVPILWARGYHRHTPLMGVSLRGVHLMGVHFTDVHLISMCLIGTYHTDVHLIGIYFIEARIS